MPPQTIRNAGQDLRSRIQTKSLLEVLVVGSPTMRLRRNHGAERRSPRRNPDKSIRWSGRFARAPFPARPGHRPPPAPLVPGRAHTGRPQNCPYGVSARDVTEEGDGRHGVDDGEHVVELEWALARPVVRLVHVPQGGVP
uniref:Uncharacterized protein n=1 Tax=Zea mays TaxID=4577 RepID=C0PIN8_MAIZE|nr:unknown [Zea mays]